MFGLLEFFHTVLKKLPGMVLLLILAFLPCGSISTCNEDICVNGFCNLEGVEPVCSCVLEWTGDNCDIENKEYAKVECVNGFVGLIDYNYVCSCDNSYQGDTCSEAIVNYHPCNDVSCNNQGYCLLDQDSTPYCTCDNGYSGDQCQHEDSACGWEYVMNIASSVYDESVNSGFDCSYFIGLLWSDMQANNITEYPGLCTCLDTFLVNSTYWADNVGCVIEENFATSLQYMSHLHCNTCSDDEISDMKAAIQDYSESCDMFITHRDEMPLYWRTPLKCVCLNSLGNTREEVGEWVYCPFTKHEARTDLTAYDNCNDESVEICDFTAIKQAIESNMKARNPSGYEVCTSAMIDLMDMVPTVGFFKYLPDDWCPCYESMAKYWSEGLDVLECKAVTFYEFTIKDLFLLYCNDEVFQNKDDLWDVAKVMTVASAEDYTAASTCQNFMVYSSALSETATENSLLRAKTLFCDCLEGLDEIAISNGWTYEDMTIDWHLLVPGDFANAVLELIDLLELFPNEMANAVVTDCEFQNEDSIFSTAMFTAAKLEEKEMGRFVAAVEEGSTSVDYLTLNIWLGLLLVVLTVSNTLLYFSSSRERSGITSIMAL